MRSRRKVDELVISEDGDMTDIPRLQKEGYKPETKHVVALAMVEERGLQELHSTGRLAIPC